MLLLDRADQTHAGCMHFVGRALRSNLTKPLLYSSIHPTTSTQHLGSPWRRPHTRPWFRSRTSSPSSSPPSQPHLRPGARPPLPNQPNRRRPPTPNSADLRLHIQTEVAVQRSVLYAPEYLPPRRLASLVRPKSPAGPKRRTPLLRRPRMCWARRDGSRCSAPGRHGSRTLLRSRLAAEQSCSASRDSYVSSELGSEAGVRWAGARSDAESWVATRHVTVMLQPAGQWNAQRLGRWSCLTATLCARNGCSGHESGPLVPACSISWVGGRVGEVRAGRPRTGRGRVRQHRPLAHLRRGPPLKTEARTRPALVSLSRPNTHSHQQFHNHSTSHAHPSAPLARSHVVRPPLRLSRDLFGPPGTAAAPTQAKPSPPACRPPAQGARAVDGVTAAGARCGGAGPGDRRRDS